MAQQAPQEPADRQRWDGKYDCLEAGELRSAFPGLGILEYRETADEDRAVASLVAARPATGSRGTAE